MRFLKTNTAVIITVGPFYDKGDGVTIETALTITNERITLTADTDAGSAPTNILDNITGATTATSNDLNYITGNDAGMMQLELSAANVNRLGRMMLSITDAANHVPVFHEFMVLTANAFDSLFGTDVLDANVTQWIGTAAATPTTAGVPEVDVTFVSGTAQTANDNGADINLILGDTGELQTDWVNGGRLDLLIDAIKVKTDSLTFTNANEVDANTKSINDAEVIGDGNATAWDGI